MMKNNHPITPNTIEEIEDFSKTKFILIVVIKNYYKRCLKEIQYSQPQCRHYWLKISLYVLSELMDYVHNYI